MYSNRKLKSSLFLRDDSYPERVLSKHRHYKKLGVYGKSRALFGRFPRNIGGETLVRNAGNSTILLESIPQSYSDTFLDGESNDKTSAANPALLGVPLRKREYSPKEGQAEVSERGLQDMRSDSFTNGLLGSGHRYFCIS